MKQNPRFFDTVSDRRGHFQIPRARNLLAFLCAALLVSCNVGPDYVPPEVQMPDAWHQELTEGLAEGEANLETWWEALGDPVLDSLVERAKQGSLDLREAYARVVEARAFLGITEGDLFPFIDALGTYQRTRSSEEIVPAVPFVKRTDDLFQGGFDVSWELDVFGGIRRSIESAGAGFEASIEGYRDVLVVLLAEVARAYVEIRTLQARLRFARSNVETQSGTLQFTQDRFDAQLVPELDVQQARLNLASTESTIPTLRSLLTQTINRLGVLLGQPPISLHDELGVDRDIPDPPERVTFGLPANLLRQRPDIRRAERELASQTARIGLATADLYPRFALVGNFNLEAHDFGDMWDQAARAYSFGPSIRWNIFDGGRIRNNIRVEDARTEQALVRYERTVLLGLEEVESAMVAYVEEANRREALARSVAAAERSVELVDWLYRTGLTDFQNVLDTQRSLFVQQDTLASSAGQVIQNLIRLYKALGGGWDPRKGQPDETESPEDGVGNDEA
jgi:multidrug efflux system outer membrane protein